MIKRLLMAFTLCLASFSSIAGGWTNWAVPTRLDVERGNGVMVYGNFGNPSQCTNQGRVYIPINHPQYDKIYALLLSAFTANKEALLYSNSCGSVSWFANDSVTFNIVSVSGAVNIRS